VLVLSRKHGEEIVIGDNIRIRVLRQHGGRVRLGITAPPTVHIARMEIVEVHPSPGKSGSQAPMRSHATATTNKKGNADAGKIHGTIRPR